MTCASADIADSIVRDHGVVTTRRQLALRAVRRPLLGIDLMRVAGGPFAGLVQALSFHPVPGSDLPPLADVHGIWGL